jgi:hypothetical protein
LYDRLAGSTSPYWPTSVARTEELVRRLDEIVLAEDFGPKPITPAFLVENICHYIGVLYCINRKYEDFNTSTASREPSIDNIAEEVSPWWAYSQLKEWEDFTSLGKRQRQKVSRQLRQQVNDVNGPPPQFSIQITDGLLANMTALVMDTRNKIANSSRVKAGDTGVPLVDCFVPGRTSQKMFQLLPQRSFRCPFITLYIRGLVGLLNFSIANTDEPNWAGVSLEKAFIGYMTTCRRFFVCSTCQKCAFVKL